MWPSIAVEIDVRLTRDGKLVLCHDEDARRVAGSALVIAESNLAELAALDLIAGAATGAPDLTYVLACPRGPLAAHLTVAA